MAKNDLPLYTTVDDATYNELNELVGQRVVHVAVWEDALEDALVETPEDPAARQSFDLDLYLEDGAYFELYGVTCFSAPEEEPWRGQSLVDQQLRALVSRKATLKEVAVDEEENLVLIAGKGQEQVYLLVGAWLLEEWDELPED